FSGIDNIGAGKVKPGQGLEVGGGIAPEPEDSVASVQAGKSDPVAEATADAGDQYGLGLRWHELLSGHSLWQTVVQSTVR
ncbi:hypothetical protein N8766_04745, partial [bacterium]|nr:hypothetical protein [bacterium]